MKAKENIPEEIPGMSRKIPFGVPDNYFNELPSRIQERLSETPTVSISRVYPIRRSLALAAMFIGLVTLGYFGMKMILNGQDARMLSGEEISTAIEYFGYQFDDDMLIAAIVESDIDLGPQNIDYESDVIIEFLSSEDIDFNEILIDY
jgi:energy-coupling factor transporter ATP-binding protein EcfA2